MMHVQWVRDNYPGLVTPFSAYMLFHAEALFESCGRVVVTLPTTLLCCLLSALVVSVSVCCQYQH